MDPATDWLAYVRDPNPWVPPRVLPALMTTKRLLIRLYRRGDGPALFEAVSSERPSLLPTMVWARAEHQTVDDSIFFVENCDRKARRPEAREFLFGMFDRESGLVIGEISFSDIDVGLRTADVGYWVRGSRRKQGFASEATSAVISGGLRPQDQGGWGFRRIVILCEATNAASRGVCERLQLRKELDARQARYLGPAGVDGAPGYQDILGFGVLADEWDCDRQSRRSPL